MIVHVNVTWEGGDCMIVHARCNMTWEVWNCLIVHWEVGDCMIVIGRVVTA